MVHPWLVATQKNPQRLSNTLRVFPLYYYINHQTESTVVVNYEHTDPDISR